MWRLLHGQLYVKRQPQLLVVMIGTNDLGAASCKGGEPAIAQAAIGAAQRYLSVFLIAEYRTYCNLHMIAMCRACALPGSAAECYHHCVATLHLLFIRVLRFEKGSCFGQSCGGLRCSIARDHMQGV